MPQRHGRELREDSATGVRAGPRVGEAPRNAALDWDSMEALAPPDVAPESTGIAPPERGAPVTMRFREGSESLIGLPWETPLAAWPTDAAEFVDLPIGASRHTVRFVVSGRGIVSLKELPLEPARREYDVLRELEARGAPAVRAAGLVERVGADDAIIATHYLARSFQFRRLFMRLPEGEAFHRDRLLDAMTNLLVELHRLGLFWGDCSLANTLLVRDGQTLQAHLVDAETSEIHERLSDGQRAADLEIAIENVAGDLADLAAMGGRGIDEIDDDFAAALSLAGRYERLWDALHADIQLREDQRYRVEKRLRALNDMGYVVDEVILERGAGEPDALHLRVSVAGRDYHSRRLRQLTGLDAGEGQSSTILNDMTSWAGLSRWDGTTEPGADGGRSLTRTHATRWLVEVYEPAVAELKRELGSDIDPVQAYCDLLEVRWLLSEEAGHDVGNAATLASMAAQQTPAGSVARMAAAEEPAGPKRLGWKRP
jgi:Domain of unknown function (DUF4032)/Lipopolysaccharide kinase (Kdo/WaaP) family